MTDAIGTAIAVADELDQIRSIYGEDCLTFVRQALLVGQESADWRHVVDGAMGAWVSSHPHPSLDLLL